MPQQQRRSVAVTRAAAMLPRRELQQHCHDASCSNVVTTRATATLPRRVLQQHRNAPATHAATVPQHYRDVSCSIITL
ncbi:unnamed protein product [Sphagnum jensenii]|uniref:Uncharacterized protein n=1 Tax=Sphagnum jensenii TaxID=128206 RepID=A0ABP1AAB1_9BRYO